METETSNPIPLSPDSPIPQPSTQLLHILQSVMPRKKAVPEPSPSIDEPRSLRKRSRSVAEPDEASPPEATAPKRRRSSAVSTRSVEIVPEDAFPGDTSVATTNGVDHEAQVEPEEQPKVTPRKRGRPPKNRDNTQTPTPKASLLRTPSKPDDDSTPRRTAAGADRSARRKSARALIEHVVGDDDSQDEQEAGGLAREIYETSEDDDATTDAGERTDATGDTPSKTPAKRGRKKRVKSPTPPRDLPPHELYFFQNKPGRAKTSNNTLSNLQLLTHDEYFTILRSGIDNHDEDEDYLESLHAESFPQWRFELQQGFSLCLYGFGSKRSLLKRFAKHLLDQSSKGKIVMVNGYTPTTSMRDVLSTAGLTLDQRIPAGPPTIMAQTLLSHLSSEPEARLTIIVNSIDAAPLRKPTHQTTLAQLASHPQITLICSADTPDFALLWDIGLRTSFNFVFHDATTFRPFTVELDVVDDVHELLGRKAQRVNGREGVAFVLKSLPENAKNLFQLLVGEVLVAMEDSGDDTGVEYRMVYNKAVEEFICSSEMAFRTLLKEYALPFSFYGDWMLTILGFMIIRLSRAVKMRSARSC